MVLTAILVFVVLATAGCGTLGLEWRRVIVQPFLEYKTDPCRVPTKWDSDKGEWVVDFGRIDFVEHREVRRKMESESRWVGDPYFVEIRFSLDHSWRSAEKESHDGGDDRS